MVDEGIELGRLGGSATEEREEGKGLYRKRLGRAE